MSSTGVLAVTFETPDDYDKIQETDKLSITGLDHFKPRETLTLNITHQDGRHETISLVHTYNANQIQWFIHGSALNMIRATAS